MKKFKLAKKALVFILMFCMSLNLIPFFAINTSAEESVVETEDISRCETPNETIYFDTENSTRFSKGEIIYLTYTVATEYNIIDISGEAVGFNILSLKKSEIDNKKVEVALSCDSSIESCFLLFDVQLSNGTVISSALYGLNNMYGTFISYISEECALDEYLAFMVETNRMTESEKMELKQEYWNDGITQTITTEPLMETSNYINANSTRASSAGSGDTTVMVILRWQDKTGTSHYLKNVKVEIYDKEVSGYDLLATLTTNDSGMATFSFDNPDRVLDFENGGYDIVVKAYPGDSNAMVGSGEYVLSTADNAMENVETGKVHTVNTTVTMNNNIGRAFQISQAIFTARDYASDQMGYLPPAVSIQYPVGTYTNTNSTNCYYYYGANKITLCETAQFSSSILSVYESWDVITHEYGHHIQYNYNMAPINRDLSHNVNLNDAEVYKDKYVGITLAWEESWPTVFGMIAQMYSYDIDDIPYVADSSYDAYNSSYDLENYAIYKGEACEGSVMATLWDLYDGHSETTDSLTWHYYTWWDITTHSGIKTFSDFMQYCYSRSDGPNYIIGKTLSRYNIAPMLRPENCSNGNSSRGPSIMFNKGGDGVIDTNGDGVNEYDLTNDQFIIKVYNDSDDLILSVNTTNYYYTFSLSQWETIKASCDSSYTICVGGRDTDSYTTGYYYSGPLTYEIP